MMPLEMTLISLFVAIVSLYLAAKAIHLEVSVLRLVLIAFIAQIIMPYILGVLLPYLPYLPFVDAVIQIFVWVGLVKFIVPRTTIFEATAMGVFAFGVNYFLTSVGLESLINELLFG